MGIFSGSGFKIGLKIENISKQRIRIMIAVGLPTVAVGQSRSLEWKTGKQCWKAECMFRENKCL